MALRQIVEAVIAATEINIRRIVLSLRGYVRGTGGGQ
jgi:hypothetical protein